MVQSVLKGKPMPVDLMPKDLEKETWKPIKGFEKLYQVSNLGRIKRIECIIKQNHPVQKERVIKERIIKSAINARGYERIILSNKEKNNFSVHRLVATAFIENPFNKPEINHIDGIKNNNNSLNLEWATPKENMNHAHKTELMNLQRGENHWRSLLKKEDIIKIRSINPKKYKEQILLAKYFQINVSTIRDILLNKTWRHLL